MCPSGPTPADPLDLARSVDRVRRMWTQVGRAMEPVEIDSLPAASATTRGWLTCDPNSDSEFPSSNMNRAIWLAADSPPPATSIDATLAHYRSHNTPRAFLWFGPKAWSPDLDAALAARGCTEWTAVKYPAMIRAAEQTPLPPLTPGMSVRVISPDEAPAQADRIKPWFGHTDALLRVVRDGRTTLLMAFVGDLPIASATIVFDAPFAYLGMAGTDPEYRGRGAQSALIAARVSLAAQRACCICISETVTAQMTSYNNLRRAGFQTAFYTRIYGWTSTPAA